MSAYHPNIAHGAGLIMLSEAYHTFFMEKSPERYADMAKAMGENVEGLLPSEKAGAFVKALVKLQKACGVDVLIMSAFGINKEEIPVLAENAWHAMGGLFKVDPYALSMDDTVLILKNAYK